MSHALRWSEPRRQVWVQPCFEQLRGLPRHLLLAELQHEVLLATSQAARCKFQGFAQASKRLGLGSRLAAKCRPVDDAHHLLNHLTPESSQLFLDEVLAAVAPRRQGSATRSTDLSR